MRWGGNAVYKSYAARYLEETHYFLAEKHEPSLLRTLHPAVVRTSCI